MKTILIIDDEEVCRSPAAAMLRRDGWNVMEAEDGERGLEMARRHRPDVILCDLLMPRMNGFHVCRMVREQLDLRHTKLVVMSGLDYASDREGAAEAGADDYLVKPIEIDQLRATLRRVSPEDEEVRELAAPLPAVRGTKIKFWGVRGSIPTPGQSTVFFGGNTSCVELRADGEIIVLDAGSGIRPLGHALAQEFAGRVMDITLLITHTHWDHIQGFPFFLPAYDAKNRLRILGYEGARERLSATLAGQMESPYFPIALKQMPGNIIIEELKGMNFQIGPVKVQACFTNHPGVCVGYRLLTHDGSVVYLPDNESCNEHAAEVQGGMMPRMIEERLAEFVRDADVLIVDSQYTADEYREHVGWGHGCVDDVVRFAIASRVKRLFLFHHDPEHDDRTISSMLMHARELATVLGSKILIEAAREGEEFTLAPRAFPENPRSA